MDKWILWKTVSFYNYNPFSSLYNIFVENEELVVGTKKKRRRIIVDSDSDSDNNENKSTKGNKQRKKVRVRSDSEDSDDGLKENSQCNADLKSFSFSKTNGDSHVADKKDSQEMVQSPTNLNTTAATATDTNWTHNKLDFLKPHKIRDINRNRPDHPDYDERTLYVPEDFLNKQTPAMRQWWILKSKHYDSVLFFKVFNSTIILISFL